MKSLFNIVALCLLLSATVNAQLTRSFSYQGMLVDAAKHPISGNRTITINVYDTPVEGIALHSESFATQIDNGLFSVVVGSTTELSTSVKFDKQYRLGVSIDNGSELS